MINKIRLYGTASALGALTVNGERSISGRIYKIVWLSGTFVDDVDAVISVINDDGNETILTLTDANSDANYYPRTLVHDATGTALTGTSGGDREMPFVVGRPRLVVSDGGDSKTGGCIIYYFED
jgi:hypothetical protein